MGFGTYPPDGRIPPPTTENLHSPGIDVVLVVTIVDVLNNEQVGPIIEFAHDNPRKISFMSTFSDQGDLVHGTQAGWGALSCGCHPN